MILWVVGMHACERVGHKGITLTRSLRLKRESRPEARSRRTTRSKMLVTRYSSPCIKIGKTFVAVQVGGRNIGMTAERPVSGYLWKIILQHTNLRMEASPAPLVSFSSSGGPSWPPMSKIWHGCPEETEVSPKRLRQPKRSNSPDFLISVDQTASKWLVT